MSVITDADRDDARLLWEYNLMGHQVRPCSAAIALGGCDIGVAHAAADSYFAGLFPLVVFTGGITAATRERFPRGEAVHFREQALASGIPDDAILVEPNAGNTGQNISFAREMLVHAGREVESVLLICMPYMQRRAYATCRKLWPEVDPICASQAVTFDEYAKAQDDEKTFIDMMMGDTHRVMEYPKRDFAIEQDVPENIRVAFNRLRARGYDGWLLRD